MSELAASATSGAISTPRFIGPGCITSCVGRRRSRVTPQRAVYSRRLGHVRGAGQHPLALHAQDVDDVGVRRWRGCRGRRARPVASMPRGISGGGPTSVTSMPISRKPAMLERATRECSTSPTIATCTPSSRPSASRMVYRSSRHCVGCWCLPSPALTTWASVQRAVSCGGADLGVADHDHVGTVGVEGADGVLERLALVHAGARALEAHGVGREALGGELEGRRGARRALEEDVHDGAAAQRRHLLHLARQHALEAAAASRMRSTSSRCEVGDVDQVALASCACSSRGSRCSDRARPRPPRPSRAAAPSTRSVRAVGRFLPT